MPQGSGKYISNISIKLCLYHGVLWSAINKSWIGLHYQPDAIFLGPRSKCAVIGPEPKQQKGQIAQVNTAELYVRRANINIFRTCNVICTEFLHFMILPSVSSSTLFSLP